MVVAVVGLIALQGGFVQAAEYTQSFEFSDGTLDLGDGSIIFSSNNVAEVVGGRLQLTRDDTGDSSANFKTPSLGADATQNWIVDFDFELFDAEGGNPPADGFSFNYGPIATDATGSEEGFGVGLSVEFDTWDNGTGEDGYNVAVNGVDVPNGFNNTNVTVDGTTQHATIVWYSGAASLKIGDEIIFAGIPTPGFSPSASDIFAFAARTGGATEDLFIDNLSIQAPIPGNPADFNQDGAVDLGDFEILVANLNSPGDISKGDANYSFNVDIFDFVIFREAFNAENGAPAGVPEPSGLLLGMMTFAALLGASRIHRR
jgi:hypothetical protein